MAQTGTILMLGSGTGAGASVSKEPFYVTLKADRWSENKGLYMNHATVSGWTATTDMLLIKKKVYNGDTIDMPDAAAAVAYNKAFNALSSGWSVTSGNQAVFYTYKKPEIDIEIGLLPI